MKRSTRRTHSLQSTIVDGSPAETAGLLPLLIRLTSDQHRCVADAHQFANASMQSFTDEFRSIVLLSLRVSGTAVLISSLIGVPLGAWLGVSAFPGRRALSALIHTGMTLPTVVVSLMRYLLLSRSAPLAGLGWLFTPTAPPFSPTDTRSIQPSCWKATRCCTTHTR